MTIAFEWNESTLQVTVGVSRGDASSDGVLSFDPDDLGLFLMKALMDTVEAHDQGRTLVMSKGLSRRVDE